MSRTWPGGSRWCEHCGDRFDGEHYDLADPAGPHRVGVEYGPYGELLAREAALLGLVEAVAPLLVAVSPQSPQVWRIKAPDDGHLILGRIRDAQAVAAIALGFLVAGQADHGGVGSVTPAAVATGPSATTTSPR